MSESEYIQVIITVFTNESAGVGAYAGLNHWDEAREDIELGSIAAIKMVDGEVEYKIDRKDGKGILVSGATAVISTVLGPITMVGGLVGGVVNTFFKKSDELTPEEIEKLGQEMDAGHVALLLVCDEVEVETISKQLQSMCGTVKNYAVPQEALLEAAEGLEEAAAQEEG